MVESLSFALKREPQAPARARERAAEFLAGVPPRVSNDVQLALSELVTNAVRHGQGIARVEIRRSDDRVRLEVTDDGDAAPEVRKEAGDASGGWGLRIVQAVSVRWGAYEGTTHVWCEIALG